MKEKAEYEKQGKEFNDIKSHLSKITGVSRLTDGSNAYLYSDNDT